MDEKNTFTQKSTQTEKPIFVPEKEDAVIGYIPRPTTPTYSGTNTPSQKKTFRELVTTALLFFKKWWWAVVIALILLSTIILAIYWMVLKSQGSVQYDDISISIDAPEGVALGSKGEWKLYFKNENPVKIYDTRITLLVDQNFQFRTNLSEETKFDTRSLTYFLDTLQPNEEKNLIFEAQLVGAIGEETQLQAQISYSPQTTQGANNDRITLKTDTVKTIILSSQLRGEIRKNSNSVEYGNDVEITFLFENLSDKTLDALQIKAIYPPSTDLVYKSSQLDKKGKGLITKPNEGNDVWNIESMESREVYTLTVIAQIQNNARQQVPIAFEVYIITQEGSLKKILETSDTIFTTPQSLVINTELVNKADTPWVLPGETVEAVVTLENKSNKTLSNLEVSLGFLDPQNIAEYDRTTIVSNTGGIKDGKKIVWKPAAVPNLASFAPGSSQRLGFRIPIKKIEKVLNSSIPQDQYTFQPIVDVRVDGGVAKTFQSQIMYRLAGSMNFQQSIEKINDKNQTVFKDDPGDFRVVRVTWTIGTTQNKLNNFELITGTSLTSISGTVFRPESVYPTEFLDKVLYNANGTITLNLEKVENYLGISKPKMVISFDLKVPEPVGGNYDAVEVMKEINVRAKDDITGQTYNTTVPVTRYR